MKDFENIINEKLDAFLLRCAAPVFEANEYVKDAPKVNGYFKFISLRYMKRVSDIKKMCVDYINTFVEGALNLAKNMDDVKLVEAKESLAKDLDFSAAGVSTDDKKVEATTKSGVLFLTSDKALKDKLDTIVKKVQERSKKSEILAEWANLMLLQSRITADDIINTETTKMLKDEKTRKEQEQRDERSKADTEAKYKKLENERKKLQKDLDMLVTQYGEVDQWFKGKDIKLDDLMKYAENLVPDDLKPDIVTDKNEFAEGKLNDSRKDFYAKFNGAKTLDEIYKELGIGSYKAEGAETLSGDMLNYVFACLAVAKTANDGSFIASPADLCIAVENNPDAKALLEKQKYQKTVKNRINLDNYNMNLDQNEAKKAFDTYVKDKNFAVRAVFYFSRLFSQEKSLLKESEGIHIMRSTVFITEEMLMNTMSLSEAEFTVMDLLYDCDGGCMYIGNIAGNTGVDYIMLDGDGGYGFYAEYGDLDAALENGEPADPHPVELRDTEKLDLLNKIFDETSKDLFSKLK